jgi:hypothetical protein
MNHDELKKQYDAEAAVNPEAWKNWDHRHAFSLVWIKCSIVPSWNLSHEYRRNPDAPLFVMPEASKHHPDHDLLVAIANGEVVQKIEGGFFDRFDCRPNEALSIINAGGSKNLRIKPKTRMVRCRVYISRTSLAPLLWTEMLGQDQTQWEYVSGFVHWACDTFTVEIST